MKKIRTVVLAMVLCAVLVACGANSAAEESTVPLPEQTQQQETEPVLAEQIIYDSDGIRITVKGMEENTATGTNIRILVENGTDRNLAVSGDLFLVNGVTLPGYLYAQVAAGTRTNDAIEFYTEVLDTAGIRNIGTIRAYDARIVDTDSYEILARVPMELTTAHRGYEDLVAQESGVELYRQEGITVIAQMISREFYGSTVQLLVKNETPGDIIVEAENVSVNGYTLDAWLYDAVVKDSVRYCQLDLFETGLAENGIEQIDQVSFRLHFLDAGSYETIARSDVLTVEVMG